jgi:hypothetical protein
MRRALAGFRAARTRSDKGVRIPVAAAGLLLLAACGTTTEGAMFEHATGAPVVTTAAASPVAATTTPAPAPSSARPTPSPTPTATPKAVAPTVVTPKAVAPKVVPPKVVVPRPVLSKPAPVRTTPKPAPKPPAAPACHPSYAGACLDPDASDYDCAGGSGNGPLYTGTVRVVGPDVFDLDRDHDGLGCE